MDMLQLSLLVASAVESLRNTAPKSWDVDRNEYLPTYVSPPNTVSVDVTPLCARLVNLLVVACPNQTLLVKWLVHVCLVYAEIYQIDCRQALEVAALVRYICLVQ